LLRRPCPIRCEATTQANTALAGVLPPHSPQLPCKPVQDHSSDRCRVISKRSQLLARAPVPRGDEHRAGIAEHESAVVVGVDECLAQPRAHAVAAAASPAADSTLGGPAGARPGGGLGRMGLWGCPRLVWQTANRTGTRPARCGAELVIDCAAFERASRAVPIEAHARPQCAQRRALAAMTGAVWGAEERACPGSSQALRPSCQ
jgi:hypothetical protein